MARTAIATLQPIWDCRWSQPGRRQVQIGAVLQPEARWVCARDDRRHVVDEDDCATCEHWEMRDERDGGAHLEPGRVAAPVVEVRVVEARVVEATAAGARSRVPGRLLDLTARAVMILTAVLLAVCGFIALEGPLLIPVAVGLWMSAATLVGLATFGRLDGRGPLITADPH